METVVNPRELRVKRGDTLAFRAVEIIDGFMTPTAMTFDVLKEDGSRLNLGSLADECITPTNSDNAPGAYNCRIPASRTAALDVRIYPYRLRITYYGGTYTVAEGNLRVED